MMSTGCIASEISQLLLIDKWDEALAMVEEYKKIFDTVVAEVQPAHLLKIQGELNDKIFKLAKTADIPIICTTDSHYLEKEERDEHQLILAIQSKRDVEDPDRFTFEASHLMETDEMRSIFGDKIVNNTFLLTEKCEYPHFMEFKSHGYRLPKYPIPKDIEYEEWKKGRPEGEEVSFSYCSYLAEKNWDKKLWQTKDDPVLEKKYRERINTELETIKTMGFVDYFLIVQDFVGWCKQNDIMTGCGRGSAGGCLLSYLLGITKLDPIKYDLLFSRFLNADRVSLPDIDMDIDKVRRDEVKVYLATKYGQDRVASIATFSTMKVRACIKDVVRSLKIGGDKTASFEIADRINKTLDEQDDNISFEDAMLIPDFAKYMEQYKDATGKKDVAGYIKKFEGLVRQTGIHAAGIIIGTEPLTDSIPLMMDKNKVVTTAYDGTTLESDGFLKMDLLGLKTLTIIADTFKNIEKTRGNKFKGFYTKGVDIFYDELSGEYETRLKQASEGKRMASKSFKLLREAKTNGVFQVESQIMRELLRGVCVNSIEDIAAVLALCRPGPLASGQTAEFGKRKRLGEDRDEWYKHSSLRPILGKTYGIFCLEENTPIYTVENGYIPIKECKKGMTIKSIQDNGHAVFKKIKRVIDNGIREVSEYRLSNGQSLVVTDDHQIKTSRGWMSIKDAFENKETIAVSRELSFGTETYDLNRLRILAYLIGDGALSTSTNVSFIAKDNVLKEKFETAVHAVFPRTKTSRTSGRTEGTEEIHVIKNEEHYRDSKVRLNYIPNDLLIWLRELKLKHKNEEGGCNSYTKFIPAFVMQLDRKHIEQFVAYLWDCDGGVSKDAYFYTTQSRQLAQDVFNLLNKLGLCPTWHYRNDGAFAILSYCNKECWESFGKHISAQGRNKQPIEKTNTNYRACYGVFSKRLVYEKAKKYIEDKGISQTDFAKQANIHRANLFTTTGKHITQLDYCNRTLAKSVQSVILDKEIEELLTEDILWYQIVSRKQIGTRQVYDLTIDKKTPNFVANGIYVHNCYQEQCMQVAVKCAGFTEPESDTLRKAIGKKIRDLMEKYKEKFIEGAMQKSGMDRTTAEDVWQDIENFASYGFNKSHAVGYAHTTYETAYLKANFPAEYFGALLSNEADQAKVNSYIREASALGIKLLPVNINKSTTRYEVENVNTIRRNLTTLKNVGGAAVEDILSKRPFKDMVDFLARTDSKRVTSRVIEALIKAGAFEDAFEKEKIQRKTYFDFYDDCRKKIKRLIKRAQEKDVEENCPERSQEEIMKEFPKYDWNNPVNIRPKGRGNNKETVETPVQRFTKDTRLEWNPSEIVSFESEIYGASVTFNIFDFHASSEKVFKERCNPIYYFDQSLDDYPNEKTLYMMVIVRGLLKKTLYKKDQGKEKKRFMRRFLVEDRTGEGMLTVFDKTFAENVGAWVKNGNMLILECSVNIFQERKSLIVNKVMKNCGGIDGTM
jgi:DNA polymerase-3 subunit alpha